jgi:hypothetical protein
VDLILARADGQEERILPFDFDFDLGGENDFQVKLTYASWDDRLTIGARVYVPGTEFGGIIKKISSATKTGNIFLDGFSWRGYLAHRIIRPASGQDYRIVSGELNAIISELVDIPYFVVSGFNTGVTVSNYKFNRYVTVLEGIESMLASVGYRLNIEYIQTQTGGYVSIGAVPAGQYGDTVEYSQDSLIDFSSTDDRMGVNHLVCLGTGELKDRIVIDLYADEEGNISESQTITGIDEITEVYDSSGAERETLLESGKDRLKELLNKKSFTSEVKEVKSELYIGDIVTGSDYITGNTVTKPIVQKLVKRENGNLSIDYKIEGEK